MNNGPVLVFDSGVGGLSVFDAIRLRLPDLPLSFACDNAGFPYGPREEADLIQRVDQVIDALIDTLSPALIVIACNTASTITLPHLRQKYSIPFVGVVPAIKPAAQRSTRRILGLLATPGTVKRAYTQQLIDEFAADCQIIRHGSTALVHIAERLLRDEAVDPNEIKQEMRAFEVPEPHRPDCIVLACTHFPLMIRQFRAALSYPVEWIDSGEAIARRVQQLVAGSAMIQSGNLQSAWMTADNPAAQALRPALQSRGLMTLRFVDV